MEKRHLITIICLILILNILPANALSLNEERQEKEIQKDVSEKPEYEKQNENEPESLLNAFKREEKQNVTRIQSAGLSLDPDYGNTVVVEINNKQDLLDKILNAQGSKDTDLQGKRIKKTYKLTTDLTVNAGELDETNFVGLTKGNAAVLYDNIDGNGKTITVNADTSKPARPLINHVNHYIGLTADDRLFIKNLNIKYNGDVRVSPFVQGYINYCDLENINITVDGNIVSDFSIGKENDFTEAYGISAVVNSIQIKDKSNNTVKDPYGNDCYKPLIIKNITVNAETIGHVEGLSPANATAGLDQVFGFTFRTPNQTDIKDIHLNFKRMEGKGLVNISVAGFGYQLGGTGTNIHVNVEEDIKAESTAGVQVCGIGGVAVLKDSSVFVGGNMTGTGTEKPYTVSIAGLAEPFDLALKYNQGTNITNNTVTVKGNMTAESPGKVYLSGGTEYQGANYGFEHKMSDNKVIVEGDMTAKTVNGQSLLTGFGSGMTEGENNTIIVKGNMTAAAQSYTAYLIGHTWNTMEDEINISNSTVEVGGVMKSIAGRTAVLNGMNLGEINVHSGNKVIVLNEEKETAGMYAETASTNSSHNAQIHGYGIDIDSNNPDPTIIRKNAVYVNGDMLSKAPYNAYTAGMSYSSYKAAEQSKIEENIVRVDGKIISLIENGEDGLALTSGFITYSGYGVEKNALYAKDGIWSEAETGSNIGAAGFIYEPESLTGVGEVFENTWLGRPGKPTAVLPENKVRAGYEDFVVSMPAGAKAENNFYTSVLEGHRVSNELEYDSANSTFKLASLNAQPLLEICSDTEYPSLSEYIIEKDDSVGDLKLKGTDSTNALLSDKKLLLPEKSIVMLTATENSNTVVKDIPGIGHLYRHGNVSGKIFIDDNNNGVFDSGEEAVNITVKAYYLNGETASGTTDKNGAYTIQIPLLSAKDPEIILKMEIPDGYVSSGHANNSFKTTNENALNLYWTEPKDSGAGILSAPPGFIVTFDSQGGTPVSPIRGVASGTTISEPAPPTKTDFIFDGWFNESACDNKWTFESDQVTGNKTLYAKWKQDSGNGSTEPPKSGGGTGEAVVKDPMEGETGENKPPAGHTPEPLPEKEPEKIIVLFFMLGVSAFAYRNKKEKDKDDEIFK